MTRTERADRAAAAINARYADRLAAEMAAEVAAYDLGRAPAAAAPAIHPQKLDRIIADLAYVEMRGESPVAFLEWRAKGMGIAPAALADAVAMRREARGN